MNRWKHVWAAPLVALALYATAMGEEPGDRMAAAAGRFVAVLDDEQRAQALVPWTSNMRTGWYFVPDFAIKAPGKRSGLPFNKMRTHQRNLAFALLNTAMSHKGFEQVALITALESVLRELEKKDFRDPELYYVTIFGEPGTDKTWAWRFEGHHLSINVTLVDGKEVVVTPSFFGANPGQVRNGPLEGLRVLGDEEDLARALVKSLNDEQRSSAILSADAPDDIITSQDRKADRSAFVPAKGVGYADLNADQQEQLLNVVRTFVGKYRPDVLKAIDGRAKIADTDAMVFAWAGGLEPGDGHYFRIQTNRYLFEYDNTQNNANHVHAVWRDFDGDFGEDLLREHYDRSHPEK